ncbi:flavodoxin family protein [Arenicella xantha]|uniref:NADPH-dependent FMN reductase n=1 Tax=Arenicella xantha TaxID=644221 RepID=A0A395JI20_9GAMM|nr:flavodoxin family protein [Arenicella xantha]RBP49229.1 hypothetical protein DFR28_104157 [Arenicella xantha]
MTSPRPSLLIIAHTPSPNTILLAESMLDGARRATAVDTQLLSPFDCDAEHVLKTDALVLFTTENFGYMSGALKDFFERVYYPCLENPTRNEAKPYALVIRAGLDGSGTNRSVHSIIKGLKWREVQPTLICKGEHQRQFIEQCQTIGETMAVSLDAGLL